MSSFQRAFSVYERLFLSYNKVRRPTFDGQVESVKEYYAMGDLFVLPTNHEAFGMVITEAMSAGLPVVVTRYAGAAELIIDRNCLIDDPWDIKEIASKVNKFVSDRKLAGMTGAALRKIVDQYTWDVTAARTIELYRKVTGK